MWNFRNPIQRITLKAIIKLARKGGGCTTFRDLKAFADAKRGQYVCCVRESVNNVVACLAEDGGLRVEGKQIFPGSLKNYDARRQREWMASAQYAEIRERAAKTRHLGRPVFSTKRPASTYRDPWEGTE
ncbi:MAG: hypothetical protein EOP64_00130 [Sphingomonas sp.]|nr:MAG: hypothetical protein EOP64_00130 [Sphingomonas sp.]